MTWKTGVVLRLLAALTAVLAIALFGGPLAVADDSAGHPALSALPSHPTNRETVQISGTLPNRATGQTVTLEELGGFGATWEAVTSTQAAPGGRFTFLLSNLKPGSATYRAVLEINNQTDTVTEQLRLDVRYESVDARWIRGDAAANRSTFVECLANGNGQCASDDHAAMRPGWLAFILVVCFCAGAYFLALLVSKLADRASKPLRRVIVAATWIAWTALFANLAFGYALPRMGLEINVAGGTFAYPLYLALLLLGVAIMIGYPVFMVSTLTNSPLPSGRGRRFAVLAGVAATLVLWRQAYEGVPEVAAGPFAIHIGWLHDALDTWTLNWPVTLLWAILTFFATPAGIASFIALALLSLTLPDTTAVKGKTRVSAVALAHGSAATVATLVVVVVATTVIGILAFAMAALALVALMAYFLYYALFAVVVGAMITWVVKG